MVYMCLYLVHYVITDGCLNMLKSYRTCDFADIPMISPWYHRCIPILLGLWRGVADAWTTDLQGEPWTTGGVSSFSLLLISFNHILQGVLVSNLKHFYQCFEFLTLITTSNLQNALGFLEPQQLLLKGQVLGWVETTNQNHGGFHWLHPRTRFLGLPTLQNLTVPKLSRERPLYFSTFERSLKSRVCSSPFLCSNHAPTNHLPVSGSTCFQNFPPWLCSPLSSYFSTIFQPFSVVNIG